MPITIKFRRGTLSQWTGANPILASGEPGLDLTNMLLKVGDGSRNWNNLPYISIRLSGGTGIGLSQNPDGSYTISSPLSISGIGLSGTYNNSPSGNYTLSLSTGLQSIANLNIPTNNYLYTTSRNTFSTGLITSAGRSLLASNGHTHSVSDITNFNSEVSGLIGSSVVYTTGNQTISGIKTFHDSGNFASGLYVNSVPVSVSGHTHNISDITDFYTQNYISGIGSGSSDNGYIPRWDSSSGITNSIIIQSGNFIGINTSPETPYQLKINGQLKATHATFESLITNPATFTDEHFIYIHSNDINNINGIDIDTEIGYANFYDKLFIDSYNPIVNITGNLNVNGTGVSLSGHRHSYSAIDNLCTGVAECVNTPLLAGTGIILSYVNGTGLYINFSGIQISSSSSGFVVKTGINDYVTRYISNANNINISYADGVAGNPIIGLSGNLNLIQDITSTGNLRANSGIFSSGISVNGTGVVLTNRKINTVSGIGGGSDLSSDITIGLTGLAYNLSNINTSGIIVTTGNNGVITRTISSSGINIFVGSGNGVGGNPIIGLNPNVSGLSSLQSSFLYSNTGYFTGLFVSSSGAFLPVSLSGHRQPYSTIDNFCTGVAECVNTELLVNSGLQSIFSNNTVQLSLSGIPLSLYSLKTSGLLIYNGSSIYATGLLDGNNINISNRSGLTSAPTINLSTSITGISKIESISGIFSGPIVAKNGSITSGLSISGLLTLNGRNITADIEGIKNTNLANFKNTVGSVTTVGTAGGPSAYGTYDQGGNTRELNDLTGATGLYRGARGGNYFTNPISSNDGSTDELASSSRQSTITTTAYGAGRGIRLASRSNIGIQFPLSFSTSSENITTTVPHKFYISDSLLFANLDGYLPGGISGNTRYWIRQTGIYTFQVSSTSGGSSIAVSTTGSGITYCQIYENYNTFVSVGDTGNIADTTTYGKVDYPYRIGKYETTNDEYVQFLNAVGRDDRDLFDINFSSIQNEKNYSLYATEMESEAPNNGIARQGSYPGYVYSSMPAKNQKPLVFISWRNAARYVNWLHNGKPSSRNRVCTISVSNPGIVTLAAHGFSINSEISFNVSTGSTVPGGLTIGTKYLVKEVLSSDTFSIKTSDGTSVNITSIQSEYLYVKSYLDKNAAINTGAYDLITSPFNNEGTAATKQASAKYWIPTENEWYKAAYYDPLKYGIGSPGYWIYPTRSDTTPSGSTADAFGNGLVGGDLPGHYHSSYDITDFIDRVDNILENGIGTEKVFNVTTGKIHTNITGIPLSLINDIGTSNLVFTTGNQKISGIKTFTEQLSAPTGNWNYLVSTGTILSSFVTPTNIKFKYDNMGIDDITTVDELLKRLVDKALYTQVVASISNNKGITIQPGTTVSNAIYTVSTVAGALSTGYISGPSMSTIYINSIGSYPINFTNSLNSGQNQLYNYTLSYNDVKRVAGGSDFLSTTTSIRFIDNKYYGVSRSGDLNNCGTQTSLQNAFTTYSKEQSLNRSLSYTYIATDTNQYYLWYIIPAGGFTQYPLDNNFIPSSNVSVGGFADTNWKFIGAYNLINTQNYSHPYYFYRYNTIQVGTFTIPVIFN